MITNSTAGTNIHEIADGIYRINTPVSNGGDDFSFNQYLIADDKPLLFHTGLRRMFPLVAEAVATVLPLDTLRFCALSHFEADECGALNEFLDAAPQAVAVCSKIGAMVSIDDLAVRAPRALVDGDILELGRHRLRWRDAPHVPHGWDCGFLMELTTGTLLCGDLFAQPGKGRTPLTESDIFGPSDSFRRQMDYFSHAPDTHAILESLAAEQPRTLACMHGSAWRGDGAALLRSLAQSLN